MKKFKCFISNKEYAKEKVILAKLIRPQIFEIIKNDYPKITENDYISIEYLNIYRKKYLEKLIKQESSGLNKLEKSIVEKISGNKIISTNIEPELDEKLTIGQRIADKVAEFGGSWAFIISFTFFIIFWMGINIWFLTRPFDPYPFILLNLVLSTLAAIQAPIIMMSQNRQEQKDRLRGEHDFQINLKSEIEIQLLHEKIDYLIQQQNERLIEIQELQLEFMEDITNKLNK